MINKHKKINSIAKSLIGQHDEKNVFYFLSYIATAEIVFKYLEQEFHKKIGLDRTKIQILDLLVVNGGTLTPSYLSRGVNRTKITITTALDNLEKQALIRSSRVNNDHRLRMITITEKGLDAVNKFLPLRREIFAQAMRCFNQEEANTFQSMINRFRENIFSLSDDSDLGDIRNRYQNFSFVHQVTKDNLAGEQQ